MRDAAECSRSFWKNCHFKTLAFLLTPTLLSLIHAVGTKLKTENS